MAESPSIAELRRLASETFGREISDQQALAYVGRLPTMVRAVETLRRWEPRLRDVEPALVQRVPGARP